MSIFNEHFQAMSTACAIRIWNVTPAWVKTLATLLAGYVMLIAVMIPLFYGGQAIVVFWKVGLDLPLVWEVWSRGINPIDQLIVEPLPHNCDFMKSPIGDKECAYVSAWYPGDHRTIYVSWYRQPR